MGGFVSVGVVWVVGMGGCAGVGGVGVWFVLFGWFVLIPGFAGGVYVVGVLVLPEVGVPVVCSMPLTLYLYGLLVVFVFMVVCCVFPQVWHLG